MRLLTLASVLAAVTTLLVACSASDETGKPGTTTPGSGVDCDPSSCPAATTECETAICTEGGICGFTSKPDGTPAATQVAGDCKRTVCVGGTLTTQTDDADAPSDGNECTDDQCSAGVPAHPAKAANAACGAGGAHFCDGSGECVACTTASQCPGTDDECQVRTCSSGICGVVFKAAGTVVTSQTVGDCKRNECDGTGKIKANPFAGDPEDDGNDCTADTCSAGKAVHAPVAIDTACGAAGASLKCNATGQCVGCNRPSDCAPSANACLEATCSAEGVCGTQNKVDGTACNDGNGCTTVDTCVAGSCEGATPMTCTALDACHGVGTCNAATGTCSNPSANEGGACSDGDACTRGDRCQAGACTPTDTFAVCLGETEPNDTCATATGAFTIPTAADGILLTGLLSPTGDADWYAFNVSKYVDLSLQTFDATGPGSCSPSAVDTKLVLYGSCGGTALATNDNGGVGNCSLLSAVTTSTVRHLAPGTYYVQVTGTGTTPYGYSLQAKYLATCGNGVREGSEDCDGGAGCGADCRLTPACGDIVVESGEQCDDGNTVSGDGCSATCQWESITEVEPNGTVAAADTALPTLTSSANLTGAVNPSGDSDVFKLSTATPNVARFEIFDSTGRDCTGVAAAMNVKLLDATGTVRKQDVPTNDTATASGIGANCPALVTSVVAGTYYVQAAKTTSGTIASYVLQTKWLADLGGEVEPNDTTAQATPTSGRDFQILGSRTAGTDVDYYAVSIPVNGLSIRAEVIEGDTIKTCENNGMDSFLSLYDAFGNALATDDDDGRGFCSAIDGTGATPRDGGAHNLMPGTYYLAVGKSSNATATSEVFTYRLAVTIR